MVVEVRSPGRYVSELDHIADHAALRADNPDLELPEFTGRNDTHLAIHATLNALVNASGKFFKQLPTEPGALDLLHDVAHRGAAEWSNNREAPDPEEIQHGSDLIGTTDVVGIAGLGLTDDDLEPADPGFLFTLDQQFIDTFADDEEDGVPIITARRFGDGRHFISKTYSGAVRFRGCKWDGQITDRNISSPVELEHCDADIRWAGTDATQLGPINLSAGRIWRTRFRGYGVGPVCGGTLKVTESIFQDIAPFSGDAHMSGGNLQANPSTGFEFDKNLWIVGHSSGDPGTGISGGFVCYNDATHSGAKFTRSYISGGGYPIFVVYLPERGGARQSNFTITDNIFGREFFRFSGFHPTTPNPIFNDAIPSTVSGNTWGPRGPHWQPGDPEEGDPIG